jgi:hypothetical protein
MSIFPTPGNPNVNATASDQWLIGEPGYNYIGYAGAADNAVSYQLATAPVTASLANPSANTGAAAGDTYNDIQFLTGSPFGGALYGNASGQAEQLWALGGTTYLYGGSGYTTFIASSGPTYMFGQTSGGHNLADYEAATAGVIADLANPSINTGFAAGDTYSNVHDLAGPGYDSLLIGDNAGDNIVGGTGDNILSGGGGSTTLNGGPGANLLTGGSGNNWFVFGGSAIGAGDVHVDPLDIIYNAEAGIYTTITNYSLAASDEIDLFPLVSSLNDGSQSVNALVQIVEDTSGTFAWLEFNGPSGWVTLAKMDGMQAGQTVGVILDGSTVNKVAVQSTTPSNETNTDEWDLANGYWSASISVGPYPGADEKVIGAGDFTGNGTDGVLWYNTNTGDVGEWQLSNGQWSASVDLGEHPGFGGVTPGLGWQVEGVGDFFGNGRSDVLWYNAGDNQTDIWELNSNGQWQASASPGTFPGAGDKVAGVGNFWGNSTSDILWYNEQTGDASEWEMSNGGWAASADLGAHPGSGWTIAGVGDFFGTGLDDVLWYNAGSGQTDVWEIQNGQWAGSTSLGTHPTGYEVVGIGNFAGNADGTTGVLFYNPSTGDTDEWLISNGHWAGSIDLGTHPGGNWQVAAVGNFTGNNTADVLWTQTALK